MSPGSAPRIPFTLLGGYLGAGKTTLLNRLLAAAGAAAGERIAVLVNDVGAVNVDAALIADHDGETLELTNGCVCCAIADDFTTTLEQVRTMDPPPDRVVMELSGVAEPVRVAPWANTTGFVLDGIVVVVDAEQFPDQLQRRFVADAVDAQVRAADLVVVSKVDLVDGRRAVERVRRLVGERTAAPVLAAADAPLDALFGLTPPVGREPGAGSPPPAVTTPVTTPVTTRVVDAAGLDRAGLDALLDGLADTTLRAKGLVVLDGTVHEVHLVGSRRHVRPRPDLDPAADDRPLDGSLVVIDLTPTSRSVGRGGRVDGIEVVSFDADGTLWDFEATMRCSMASAIDFLAERDERLATLTVEGLVADRGRIGRLHRDEVAPMETLRHRAFEFSLRERGVIDPTLVDDVTAFYLAERFADPILYDDAVPTLDRLAERYALALVSNGNSDPERCGLPGRFATTLFADRLGIAKPDPRIYDTLVAESGCAPSAVLHVGDSLTNDVAAAAAAGLRTVWLNRSRAPLPPDAHQPDLIIATLADLPIRLLDE